MEFNIGVTSFHHHVRVDGVIGRWRSFLELDLEPFFHEY